MQRDLINESLAHIREGDRWLLVSKDVEGVSLAELSQMTGLSEMAIKSRLLPALSQGGRCLLREMFINTGHIDLFYHNSVIPSFYCIDMQRNSEQTECSGLGIDPRT
jgi:hypothetical protein